MKQYNINDTLYQLNDNIITDPHLVQRGIAESAYAMEWICDNHSWVYPVFDFDGNVVTHRGKRYPDKDGKKYFWAPGKQGATYYHHLQISKHVTDNNGILYVANGEPSVLAYHAAGIYNTLSWFGESSIPSTLTEDLNKLGVKQVIYAPDNDRAGLESAIKLRDMLYGTDIELTVLDLSAHVDNKGDTNDLLIALDFDADRFISTLHSCPPLVMPAYNPPKRNTNYNRQTDNDSDLIEQVAKALGVFGQPINADGWTRKPFSSPFREDRNPSAGFNFKTGVMNDFGDTSYSVHQLAEYFGIKYTKNKPKVHHANDLNEIPDTVNNPIKIDNDLQPVNLAQATMTVNMPYISDIDIEPLLDARQVGILSPTGTGKTVLIKRYVQILGEQLRRKPRILVVNHRQALSRNQAQRLGFDCYLDNEPHEYASLEQLVICINSLHHLIGDNGLPFFDAIILDEPQHLLNHLLSNTFTGNEATNAYTILRHYIKTTPYLLTLDAHLSQATVGIIENIRPGKVTVIENTYRKDRVNVNVYLDEGKTLDSAIVRAGNTNKLVVACETIAQSESVYDYIINSDTFDKECVLLVNSDTSNNPEQRAFLASPDEGLQQYRVIIHTSTIDSGVSFESTQAVVCGLFNGRVHVASDINQMLARVRNPIELFLYVAPYNRTDREINALNIYNKHLQAARQNHALITIDNGNISATTEHKQLLHMKSLIDRDRNKQYNRFLDFVVAYLKFDGFKVQLQYGKNETVNQILTDNRDNHTENMKSLRLNPDTIPLSSGDYEELQNDVEYTMTNHDHAAYDKWKVISAVGDMPYTEQLDDDLHGKAKRQKLYNLTDLYHDVKYLNQYDIEDVDLLHKRKYRTLKQHVHRNAIRALFGTPQLEDATGIVLAGDELQIRAESFVSDNRDNLNAIGFDPDGYKSESRLIMALLDKFAVRLDRKKVRIDSANYEYFYQIDTERLNRWLQYKESRQHMLAEKEADKYGLTLNTA